MSKSSGSRTSRTVPTKPKKPYPLYPLYPHPLGYWSKKVNGRLLHFGRWGRVVNRVVTPVEDQEAAWKEALGVYKARVDDAAAGNIGPGPVVVQKSAPADGYLVKDLCNEFRTAKRNQKNAGELSARMYDEYALMCDLVVTQFGKDRRADSLQPADFAALREAMVRRWGPHRVLNGVTRVKTIFKFAYDAGKLDRLPRYGQEFKPPSRSVLRRHRAKAGAKMFEASELRQLIDGRTEEGETFVKPEPVMRAMILLGINAGFGNGDCAALPISAVNLETGWVEFPRPKTGIARRCPLWPETVAAVRAALEVRPKPKASSDCGLLFLTYRGTAWVRQGAESRSDYVSQNFKKLLKALRLNKPGCGFYTLRHVFRTVADGARDNPAVRMVMGHDDATIDAAYRERIDDSRLRAVADHVRDWLWPEPQGAPSGT